MQSTVLLSLVSSLLFFTSSFAQAEGFEPLVGSDWAKQNPGLLPFDRCEIQSWNNNQIWTQVGGSFFVGKKPIYDGALLRLHCVSEALRTEFAIPVTIESFRYAGLTVDVGAILWNKKLDVSNLNGRRVSDLFGKYRGLGGGAGVGVGFSANFMANKKLIMIRDASAGIDLGISLASYGLTLNPREEIANVECREAYMLTEMDAAECGKVNVDSLLKYRFVKTKKPKKAKKPRKPTDDAEAIAPPTPEQL